MPGHESVEAAIAAIRDDRRRGASELARAALDALALAAETAEAGGREAVWAGVERAGRALIRSRPSMAALVNAVAACVAQLPARDRLTVRTVEAAARETRAGLDSAAAGLVDHGAQALLGVRRAVTLSYSASVAAVLRSAPVEEIVVGEGRPGLEGRELARRLAAAGRPATLVTDAQLGRCLSPGAAVVVGADSLLPDGSIVNKAGTLLLAATATALGVPVLVVADTWKLAAWWRPGEPVELEAMAPAEVWPDPPDGVSIENVYFDHTPARFVTSLVTEHGPLTPEALRARARELAGRCAEVYAWRG